MKVEGRTGPRHLERPIEGLGHYGSTTTSLVLPSPVARRSFDRPSA
jgi:hypothetical protein